MQPGRSRAYENFEYKYGGLASLCNYFIALSELVGVMFVPPY